MIKTISVELEMSDIIEYIENYTSNKDVEILKNLLNNSPSNTISPIKHTQLYEDLMIAVESAVNRSIDIKNLTNYINNLK
jgi:hypothetical protein